MSRFDLASRTNLRALPRWHRLGYVVQRLEVELVDLAQQLEVPPGGRVLDYGCADGAHRSLFAPDVDYVGADLPGNPDAAVAVQPDGSLPIEDGTFDAVVSTQVLEHVLDPSLHLSECARVLRPGGRLLLSTHGLMVLHPDPVDHWRWTSSGLRVAVERAGMEVIHFRGIVGAAASGLQLVQDSVLARLSRRADDPGAHGFRTLRAASVALAFQTLMAAVDRRQTQASRDLNAMVYALLAERPRTL